VVNVLSDDGFRVECFDAASVSGGPIAVLRSVGRDRLPFLLHSVLTTSARPAPHMERLSPATELLAEVSARAREKLPDALRAAVHEVAESFVAY
ncbi:MAG: carotenoid oxygenase, partial [Actinomycetota bacterium]